MILDVEKVSQFSATPCLEKSCLRIFLWIWTSLININRFLFTNILTDNPHYNNKSRFRYMGLPLAIGPPLSPNTLFQSEKSTYYLPSKH